MNDKTAPGDSPPEHDRGSRMYTLNRDGEFVMRGAEVDVWKYLHRKHSFSVSWATAHEGYEIIPEGEGDAENPEA